MPLVRGTIALAVACCVIAAGQPASATTVTAASTASSTVQIATTKTDARLTRKLFVDPTSSAAVAFTTNPSVKKLAQTPQAYWMTTSIAVASAQQAALTYATNALAAGRTPVVALYAIPGRDCGGYSSGGFDTATYKKWITAVAAGLKGKTAMVVLEPDALAFAGTCTSATSTYSLLAWAGNTLTKAGAWVYLDAGHAHWKSVTAIADRLKKAGVSKFRGFSLNVSNFDSPASERTYGRAVVAALKKKKVSGSLRFVIDTSRSGATVSGYEGTCNPPSARVGRSPAIVNSRGLDAYLWVKHPGESDGNCHGGDPAAGVWWDAGALRLLGK